MTCTIQRRLCYLICRYFLPACILVIVVMSLTTSILQAVVHKSKCQLVPEMSSTCLDDPDKLWYWENANLKQDDPKLLQYIRKYHLEPPSTRPYPMSIEILLDPSPIGSVIQAIFQGKKHGFFVEAGAFNGIQESNTLVLERDFEWTGLLVEGNSFMLKELRLAYRKAWIADACLALTPHPQKVLFTHNPDETSAGMIKYADLGSNPSTLAMQEFNENRKSQFVSAGYVECFPVLSLLKALNVSTVDYFSLDVEGAELRILRNIPFELIDIKIFSVEHWIVDGGVSGLDEFFKSKGYSRIALKSSDAFYAQNSILKNLPLNLNGEIIIEKNLKG